jgi:inosose dehydratase
MRHIEVGTAPDSWGVWFPHDPHQVPFARFLDEVVEAGYSCIELGPWGYLPTEPGRLAKELEKRELKLVATTVGCNLLDDEAVASLAMSLSETASLQRPLGAAFVVLLPAMTTDLFTGDELMPRALTKDDRARFNSNVERLGKHVTESFGLVLTVHPHVDSHLETEEEIEGLLAYTDPNYVSLCFDVGHHAYAGGDACAFLRRHAGRIPYIHLKNCDGTVLAEKRRNGWSFAEAVRHNIMCEPWKGLVDFENLRRTLEDIGYSGFAVVEQDLYPTEPDRPLPIARETRQYLKSIGIG